MQTSWCRKPYYPNSDTRGTETGACEYGMFGAKLNNGDVLASASLYRNGVGCGACYQITESSNFPYYLEFEIWYQHGNQDIIAVQLCETVNLICQLLGRTHGAVWAAVSPPSDPLSEVYGFLAAGFHMAATRNG
nr:unnamed protein product [Digitaria exilis]